MNDALLMAIWRRKPAKGLIWYTDRGSQYASDNHREILKQQGIEQSMSRKGAAATLKLPDALVSIPLPSKPEARAYDCPRQPHIVRLLRVVTPNGKTQVLMTSLLDSAAYSAASFTDLYHAHWRIEEAFKRINHLVRFVPRVFKPRPKTTQASARSRL
jgi:transposase InsO family protein